MATEDVGAAVVVPDAIHMFVLGQGRAVVMIQQREGKHLSAGRPCAVSAVFYRRHRARPQLPILSLRLICNKHRAYSSEDRHSKVNVSKNGNKSKYEFVNTA